MAKLCARLLYDRLVVSTGETVAIINGRNAEKKPFLLTIDVPVGLRAKSADDEAEARPDKSATAKINTRGSGAGDSGQVSGCHILCLRGCSCGLHVAVTNSRKQLAVIKLPELRINHEDEKDSKIVFSILLHRNALCVAFVGDCSRVLVADKSGDVVAYDLISGNRVLLFGHLAIILDIVISADDKYVITCDRDEKIKTTNNPNTYNIQSYCLGHSEYVIAMGIIFQNKDILYSASGDGTIRLWQYKNGKCLHVVDCKEHFPVEIVSLCKELQCNLQRSQTKSCEADGERSTAAAAGQSSSRGFLVPIKKATINEQDVIAVIFQGLPIISIFRVSHDDTNDRFFSDHLQNLSMKSEPWDVCFDGSGNLFVLCPPCDGRTAVTMGYTLKDDLFFPVKDDSKAAALLKNIDEVWPLLNVSSDVPSVIPTLFKQWFDNVTDYYETKEKRSNLRSTVATGAHQEKKHRAM